MTHALPVWLEPVLAFINTIDVEDETDELADGPAALSAWLVDRGLIAADTHAAATRADHRLALDLRSGLRSLALRNNGGPFDDSAMSRLRHALDRLPLVAEIGADIGVEAGGGFGQPSLRPYRLNPVRGALGIVVAGYARAAATGDWSRIRRCPADDCAWAFWDSSAKGTRRWCTMSVCGNRAKVRAFAKRRRPTSGLA